MPNVVENDGVLQWPVPSDVTMWDEAVTTTVGITLTAEAVDPIFSC